MLRFTATINVRNGNPYLPVSAAQAQTLKRDWRRPMPVLVRINRQPAVPWCINLMPAGNGGFFLYLHGDVRKVSGTKVGDRVHAEVRFDVADRGGPRHPLPAWFFTALNAHPKAREGWEKLIPSRKKEILRYFSWLKSSEARARNVQRAMHVLAGGTGRFLGRSWNDDL